MEEYLQKVKDRLEEKGMGDFWIFPDKTTFKPLSVTEKQMIEKFKAKVDKYQGQKVANVGIYVNTSSKNMQEGGNLISIMINVLVVKNDGTMTSRNGNSISIKYRSKDLEIRKFTTKDLFHFIKLCADDKISSDPIGGITLENLLKRLKKQKINLD